MEIADLRIVPSIHVPLSTVVTVQTAATFDPMSTAPSDFLGQDWRHALQFNIEQFTEE